MSLQIKPPAKTKSSSLPMSLPPWLTPSFSLLPDDITVNYLARIPRSYYPTLSIVCKSFRSLLSSSELYAERSRLGNIEKCLYVCLRDPSYQFTQWFTLWVKHNQIGQLLVPIQFSNFASLSISTVAVGFEIYVIGGLVDGNPSSVVRIINCRSHTCGDAPSMNVAREYASVCVYDGKIYVLGGCKRLKEDEPWAEVFDTKTQTWERLSDPGTEIRKCVIYGIGEMEGKIYFETKCNRYSYDTKHGKWECCEDGSAKFVFMRSGCVMENVLYVYSQNIIWCYDIKGGGNWKKVKGLDSLAKEHMIRNGGSSDRTVKLVNCGGKLLLIWEEYTKSSPNYMNKIWSAQIVLEKCDGGEVWGNVECVDVMHTITTSSYLSHALVVSV